MNHLNSILLEGTLTADPVDVSNAHTKECTFHIANSRFHKVEGLSVETIQNCTIETTAKIAEQCLENLKKGHGVRVVGRLSTRKIILDSLNGKEDITFERIVVSAEHVEFKPHDGN